MTKDKTKVIWTKFQPVLPCPKCGLGLIKHKACELWEAGWRVSLRHFLFIKWLEFTHD